METGLRVEGRSGVMLRMTLFFVVLWITVNLVSSGPTSDDHARLISDLTRTYNKTTRPSRNQSRPTHVLTHMFFILVHQLDMRRQILKSNGWIRTRWPDEFLQWDPTQYGGIEEIDIPQSVLWTPDIMAYNTANENRQFGDGNYLINVHSAGQVRWSPDFNFETSCRVDITLFPFDTQECSVQLCSWMQNNKSLILFSNQSGPNLDHMQSNGEFDVTPSTITKFYIDVDMLSFGLILRRKVTYYVLGLLLPVAMLSLLCVVSFLVPSESGEKMTMSMTTLLSFTVYLGVIDETMPKTSENISLIVVYITSMLAVSLASVLGNAVILILHHRKNRPPVIMTSLPACAPHGSECQCERLKGLLCLAYLLLRESVKSKSGAQEILSTINFNDPTIPSAGESSSVKAAEALNRRLLVTISTSLALISVIITLLFVYIG